jgi:hypothetical protein
MNDKCSAHDDCLGRIHERIEVMLEKLDDVKDELREWRSAIDVRVERMEMRLSWCEEQLKASESSRTNAKRQAFGGLIDLLKMAVVGAASAAAWAYANGYQG